MPGTAEVVSEFVGTALFMVVGLSAVIFDFTSASPMAHWIPDPALRRLVTGVVFAGGATAVVYSPLGRRSGGHLNPAVTVAFWRLGKIGRRGALSYAAAQVLGALLAAALVRVAWGTWAEHIHVGATLPGRGGLAATLLAEAAMTFLLVTLLLNFIDRPRWMPYTPAAAGALVALLVFIEAPVSGTSLNPARSLGPALVARATSSLWAYLVAPPAGALLAVGLFRLTRGKVACAKLFHRRGDDPCPFFECRYTHPSRQVRPTGTAGTPGQP